MQSGSPARRILLISSIAVGLMVAYQWSSPGRTEGPASTGPVPTAGRIDQRKPVDPERVAQAAPAPPSSPEEVPCDVPPIDGVGQLEVRLAPDLERDATGGLIPPGKYRLVAAETDDPEKLGGVWTLLFDFASDGQGAFYRKLGLRQLSSRIRYQTSGARLTFEMSCPDLDPRGMSFFYSVRPDELRLMTDEGVVLSLKRFADSEVEGLAPPRKLPTTKPVLPPRY